MKKSLIIFILSFLNSSAQQSFEIKGEVIDLNEKVSVYIKKNEIILDSTYLKNNQFVLKGKLDIEPDDLILIIKSPNQTYEAPLYIGNEKISLKSSINDFPNNIKTEGSKYDGDRFEYMNKITKLYKQEKLFLDELERHKINNTLTDSIVNTYYSNEIPKGKITLVHENFQNEITEFIKTKINSNFALKLLNLSKENFNKKDLEQMLNNFNSNFKYNYDYTSIKNFLNNFDLEENDKFIDFEAYNSEGKTVLFSSYFTSDYVLLNFSSMYCHWCEEAKKSLTDLKKKLGDKIKIINFYIDEEPSESDTLLNQKTTDWEIIWDPERKLSNDYMKYKIQSTPTFYLFDNQGYLIKKIDKNTTKIDQQIENIINNK